MLQICLDLLPTRSIKVLWHRDASTPENATPLRFAATPARL
jgi:hypothetical protein